MQLEIVDGNFVIDATLVGDLLQVPASEVLALMQNRAITSLCERGVDVDQGLYRLNFYYRARHARLRVDTSGHVLQRSVIDFGERPAAGGAGAQVREAKAHRGSRSSA
jgi:hypothetical protein